MNMNTTPTINHRLEGAGKGHGDRSPDAHKKYDSIKWSQRGDMRGFRQVSDKRFRKTYK
jgi:hypothetical protein